MRVLVVDDEALARARLIRMLGAMPDVEVVGEAGNGAEALARVADCAPELVLLDIEMPGIDGLAFAEARKDGAPAVVFTTAHVQFAADAFDLDAVDYLIKPVRMERLERALQRVRTRLGAPARADHGPGDEAYRLVVQGATSARFADARRVAVFRADEKYTMFELDGEEHLLRESLDALEHRLAPLGFLRVHRGALVRRDAIVEATRDGASLALRLASGEQVEVSRRAAPEVRRRLGLRD
jgi:DNA-binding LytR/AlgR family response regulator